MADFVFPHLTEATSYPTANAQPYAQWRNRFDYTRWDTNTRIQLLSVNWDNDGNAVDWQNRTHRDEWFQSQQTAGESVTMILDTPARMISNTMRLPLPYDMTGLWNYVHVTLPIATSADDPLPYEGTAGTAVLDWFFFITRFEYKSPSCTELTLEVDWWTTFQPNVQIQSVQLMQGHWAQAHSASVADFLADPLAHTENLMDDEADIVSGGRQTRTKLTKMWNTGTQVILFDMGAVYPFGDWSGATPASTEFHPANQNPTGYLFAIPTASSNTFLTNAPAGFWQAVKAMWIVPERYITYTGNPVTFAGTQCRIVLGGKADTSGVTLTESDFSYPPPYADLTKLYTGQYARVVIVRSDGTTIDIPPENLGGNVSLQARMHVADDGVRLVTYLTGVEYDGTSSQLEIQLITAQNAPWSGAWQQTVMEHDIPCYQIQQPAQKYYDYQKTYTRQQARNSALAVYRNAVASADTARSNVNATADTTYSNQADEANKLTADAALANQINTWQIANRNTYLDMTTSESTYLDRQETEAGMQYNADMIGVTLPTSNNQIQYGRYGSYDSSAYGSQAWKLYADAMNSVGFAVEQTAISTDAQKERATISNRQSTISTVAGAALSTLGAGVSDAQSIAGLLTSDSNQKLPASGTLTQGISNAGSLVNMGVGIWGTNANLDVAVTAASDQLNASAHSIFGTNGAQGAPQRMEDALGGAPKTYGSVNLAYTNLVYSNRVERVYKHNINNMQVQHATNLNNFITDVNETTLNLDTVTNSIGAANSRNLILGGNRQAASDSTKTLSLLLPASSGSVTGDFHQITQGTGTGTYAGTAPRSRDTTKANATRTHDTSTTNAKRTYDNATAGVAAGVNTDNRGASIGLARFANTGVYAARPEGVQVQVRRASDGDIMRIGDRFHRYGYICHRRVDRPVLSQMTGWTYWQCSEVWIASGRQAPNQAMDSIKTRLMQGVTVWTDPSRVGELMNNAVKGQ